jgi:hypothetical protein
VSAPDASFRCIADGGATLAAELDAEELRRFRPEVQPGLSRWDAIQNGAELDFHQSDCNWFAFEAGGGGRRFAGIVSLHRTGPRLERVELDWRNPTPLEEMPRSLRPFLGSGLASLLPVQPRFDARPLFFGVLYDFAPGRPAERFEVPVEGSFDPARFSFVERQGRQQILQATAAEWRPSLPPILQAFFHHDGPAFALRATAERFTLELFLRPAKDPVAYGPGGDTALRGRRLTIHYVQRPRLELVGTVTVAGQPPVVVRGDATQDRHWLTVTDPALRWMWLMARLDDGRECMAYEMRTADGGRDAPADSGRPAGGGAWIVERNGVARPIERWTLRPLRHIATPRGLVPSQFMLDMPDERLRFVVEHEQPTFVPTRALGELVEAGIWESPARLLEGPTGGRFWVDVMPPYGAGQVTKSWKPGGGLA